MARLMLCFAFLAMACNPSSTPAGCHAVHVQKQAVVAYAPAYPGYVYQVGQGLQLRAAIEVAKEELRAEMRAMQLNSPGNSESSPERLPLTASGDPYSLVNKYCVGCHSTSAKASEAFDMSSLASLTCDERIVAINAVLDGRMPKGTKIPQELIGDLLGQLSQADTAPNANARGAAPVREELTYNVAPPPLPVEPEVDSATSWQDVEPPVMAKPWKFKQGDIVYAKDFGDQQFAILTQEKASDSLGEHRGYRVYYQRADVKGLLFKEEELAWKPFPESPNPEGE